MMNKQHFRRTLFILLMIFIPLLASGCSRSNTKGFKNSRESEPGREVVSESVVKVDEETSLSLIFIKDKNIPLHEKAEYNTFDVYRVTGGVEEKVYSFNKEESLKKEEYFTDFKAPGSFLDLKGLMAFTLTEDTMGTQSLLILHYGKETLVEAFYGVYTDDYKFTDIDKNGSTELMLGLSGGGGYVSWWSGFNAAYEIQNGSYQLSYPMTLQYHRGQVEEGEKAFEKNPGAKSLKALIDALIRLGDKDRLEKLIKEHSGLIEELSRKFKVQSEAAFADFILYQTECYKGYWKGLFPNDIKQEDEKENGLGLDSDPYLDRVRAMGETEEVLFYEIKDMDLDGVEEAVIATGSEDFVSALYILREGAGGIEVLGDNLAASSGYGIYEVRFINLQNKPQTYVYCGLSNGGPLNGFMLYEVAGNESLCIAYSASATGSGDDQLIDSDQDGFYDGYVQFRGSYDVLYYDTARYFVWKDSSFIHESTSVNLPEYPSDPNEVVLQFLGLNTLNDGLCPEVKERLAELCTIKPLPELESLWFEAVYNLAMGFEDTATLKVVQKGKKADAVVQYADDKGTTHQLNLSLEQTGTQWRIVKIT